MSYWRRYYTQPQALFLRKALFQVHLWLGLALGLYIGMLSLTGSALVLRGELDEAFATPRPAFEPDRGGLPPEELKAAALRTYPGYTVSRLGDRVRRRNPVIEIWLDRGADHKERLLNPYTGKDLGDAVTPGTRAILWLASLHDELLLGETGRFWNGIGSALVTLLCFTGAFIWWPGIRNWRRSMTVKWKASWPRLNFDLHSAAGFWFFAIIVLWAFSGVYLAIPQPFGAVVDYFSDPEAILGDRAGDIFLRWLVRIHFGRWESDTLKAIWVVLGLVPVLLLVTGVGMWWQRVLKKRVVSPAVVALALTAFVQVGIAQTTLPNPYQTVADYFRLPDGRTWGATSAVEIDKDGRSVWVAERCGANTCFDEASGRMSTLPTILKFDPSGKLVTSFGAGMMIFPHGIHVDRDGNVWVTDGQPPLTGAAQAALPSQSGPPAGSTRGHQVYKFSPDGKLLMTLGTKGGAAAPDYFYYPNDVLVAPNGDIFVSEGHGSANARILKFRRDGTFIKSIGRKGSGRGELNIPHALAMDSRGRLFVGDRGNNRIQILDQDGNFIDEWTQFSRPSGVYIDKQDMLYVADSESGSVAPARTDWKRGIRIGSARDGKVMYFIPDPDEKATGTSAAEGVAADSTGIVYGAEVGPRAVKRYAKGQGR